MFNKEHFNRFMNFAFDTKYGCMEFVCWGGRPTTNGIIEKSTYNVTYGGWFDRQPALEVAARKLHNVSGYVSINPINNDRLSQTGNSIAQIKKGEGTKNEDITSLRHILIDIDYDRGNSKISSTIHELEAAFELRSKILDARPEIRENAIWGCSGNAAYILLRVTRLENKKSNIDIFKKYLEDLAKEFGKKGRDKAHIDTGPHFPTAHIGLPGTMKCKGTSTDDRPWRIITVDGGIY